MYVELGPGFPEDRGWGTERVGTQEGLQRGGCALRTGKGLVVRGGLCPEPHPQRPCFWRVGSEVACGPTKGRVSRQLRTWVLEAGPDWRRKSGTHWRSGRTASSRRGATVVERETKGLEKVEGLLNARRCAWDTDGGPPPTWCTPQPRGMNGEIKTYVKKQISDFRLGAVLYRKPAG